MEPRWLDIARKYLGVKEIKGPQHHPTIVQMWKDAKLGGIKNDEIPWCAGFVGAVLELAGVRSARADSARSYLKWGMSLGRPMVGAIVIFERGPSSGHVGFVVGQDIKGNLMVLGGNQSDMVKIAPFDKRRVIGYRWPGNETAPGSMTLPVIDAKGEVVSTNEA